MIRATAQVDLRFLCHLAPDSRKCLASGNPKITFFFFKTAIKHVYILSFWNPQMANLSSSSCSRNPRVSSANRSAPFWCFKSLRCIALWQGVSHLNREA